MEGRDGHKLCESISTGAGKHTKAESEKDVLMAESHSRRSIRGTRPPV